MQPSSDSPGYLDDHDTARTRHWTSGYLRLCSRCTPVANQVPALRGFIYMGPLRCIGIRRNRRCHSSQQTFTATIEDFTAYIRRRWPCATILLIKPKDERADYAMYDERITSRVSPKIFLAAIERLGACSMRARRPIASTPCSQALTQNGSSRPKVTGAIQRH
jgi:hypothetical protein